MHDLFGQLAPPHDSLRHADEASRLLVIETLQRVAIAARTCLQGAAIVELSACFHPKLQTDSSARYNTPPACFGCTHPWQYSKNFLLARIQTHIRACS